MSAAFAQSANASAVVSLTFDNGSATQYQVRDALTSHGMKATFYVSSGDIGSTGTGSQARMSWQQVSDLASDGDDIGGITLDYANLTQLTAAQAQNEICTDRSNLIAHGLSPVSFAYPGGAYNSSVESIAQGCGYKTARGVPSGSPPTQGVAALPPADPFALPVVVEVDSFTSLLTMESYVTQAEASGGWAIFEIGRVCGPGCDVADAVQLSTLNAFLDWLAARQGSGTTVKTVAQAFADSGGGPPDTTPPTSQIACNDSTCQSTPYSGSVSVSLTAADNPGGSGVSAIRYTTDGSDPTSSSTAYSGPFSLSQNTTVKYRAFDNAGNAEAVNSQAIQVTPVNTHAVVSLSFDFGSATQYQVRDALASHSMKATFYVSSGSIGSGGAMSWQQVTDLASDGNEIGGITLDGANLTQLTAAQAQNEVCTDRSNLIAHGLSPLSFAYPAGAFNSSVESIVQGCGYTTGRGVPSGSPPRQGVATLPPSDPFGVPVVVEVDSLTPLLTMESYVTQAEASGGWAIFEFGRVCGPGCDLRDAVQLSTVNQFLDWLATRASSGTSVKTVGQAFAGSGSGPDNTPPSSQIHCNSGANCSSGWFNSPVSVSLTATDSQSGVSGIRYTTDGSDPTSSSTLYTGPFTVSQSGTTVKYRAFDNAGNVEAVNSQLLRIDAAAPASSIQCNGTTCASTTYQDPVGVSLSATDTGGSGVDSIHYTTDGSDPTSSSPTYSSPFTVSRTSTVKFRAFDVAGNAEAVNSRTINVAQGAVEPTIVSFTFDDDDASQYQVRPVLSSHGMHGTFYVNSGTIGTDGTGSSARMSWQQVQDLYNDGNEIGGHTIDHADLPTLTTDQQQHEVCDDRQALLSHGFNVTDFAYPYGAFNAGVQAVVKGCGYSSARAFDEPQPGMGPETLPPGDPYALKVDVSADSTTTAQAMENAISQVESNGGGWVIVTIHRVCGPGCDVADAIQLSQLSAVLDWLQPRAANNTTVQTVQQALGSGGTNNQPPPTDRTAPTTSITCNGGACGAWYTSAPSVALSATDTGGSGVAAIRYTTNGSDPTTSSTLYTAPIVVNSTTTLKYRAWDAAGNVEATHTVTIGVDSTAPTTTLRCNGTTCSTGWYSANVTASLSATDNSGGSGLSVIRYTTNGTAPSTSSTVFTSPFTITDTTTVSYRAWDVAGNVESTKSTSVRIDKSAPIVAITSPLSGSRVTGNVTVSATAIDSGGSGIASVAFRANGTTFATDRTSPYSATWPTAPAGSYTLTAVATDAAGNSTTSTGVNVTR